ncbi:MAG TPA: hypothetical protein VKP00_09545 [Gemmatimonadaceae bacterium]|nr:hypothetical protein [Gemmatimonadaceae bacterium]
MSKLQRLGDRFADRDDLGERQLLLALEPLPKRAAVHVRQYEKGPVIVLARAQHRDNVRMLQPSRDANLAQETFGADLGDQLVAKDLDGDGSPVRVLASEIHNGRSAATGFALDRVPASEHARDGTRSSFHLQPSRAGRE